jgi:hypothetical protein
MNDYFYNNMNEMQKIDQKKLETYSLALSEKLTNEFFINNTSISGEQILKFTPLEQVNLFIIKNLFDKWKEENSKLKSPYFDYENGEVKEALNGLLIKISKHISVKRDHFLQLLNKAIKDTFLILFEPVPFLSHEYLNSEKILISELTEREKYIRINRNYLKMLIQKFEGDNNLNISKAEANSYLVNLLNVHSVVPEESDSHFNAFSSLLRIEPGDILVQPMVVPAQEPAKVLEPSKFKEAPAVKASNAETIINEKFSKDYITLNDKLRQEEGETLIQRHSKRKILEIKEAITLNQKFIFIKELFKGDAAEYNKMLSSIDECDNYQSALHLLNNSYSVKWGWQQDKEEVKEFYNIVERKFTSV